MPEIILFIGVDERVSPSSFKEMMYYINRIPFDKVSIDGSSAFGRHITDRLNADQILDETRRMKSGLFDSISVVNNAYKKGTCSIFFMKRRRARTSREWCNIKPIVSCINKSVRYKPTIIVSL